MTAHNQPNRIVSGRYLLYAALGSAGFGRMWKAHDKTLGVDVAIKEVWLPPAASDAKRDRQLAGAEREARNAAELRRPSSCWRVGRSLVLPAKTVLVNMA